MLQPGKDAAYWLARVGDGAALRHALGAENAAVNLNAFADFFNARIGSPERFPLPALTQEHQHLLGTSTTELGLSRLSLDEHKLSHPEMGPED